MMQRSPHKCLPSNRSHDGVPSPKITFLHLPQGIRRRIYLDAGLVSKYPIHLNYLAEREYSCVQDYDPDHPELGPIEDKDRIIAWSNSHSHFLDGPGSWPKIQHDQDCTYLKAGATLCECDALPYQLLYVSKAIVNEVAAIFYSENHFTVFRNSFGGLSALGSLSHKALSQMTSLSIYLNIVEGSELFKSDGSAHCHVICSASKMDRASRKEAHWDETDSVKEWQQLCKILRPNIKPNRLKLFLTCDVADIKLSDEFLQPLLHTPTLQLRECSIRLASEPRYHTPFHLASEPRYHMRSNLPELAGSARLNVQQAAEQLATNRSTQSSFRYRDLPKEIRLRILEHTELVSPFGLAWASEQPKGLAYQPHKSPFYEHRRRYLRSLSLDYVGAQVYNVPDSLGMQQWRECLSIINNEMNPRQLSLTIDLGFEISSMYHLFAGNYGPMSGVFYADEAEHVWTVGKGLADSLVGHVQLKDLFVHFMWPYEDDKEEIPRDRGMVLEKMVMGENYESTNRGKNERRQRWNGVTSETSEIYMLDVLSVYES
ncbi:hypothetical protein B7494_g4966 [Chlorociboria aeruginascens]|nr:hypothetical protein B7494_g4966 [Chlorociboria aeruginascens]